MQGEGRFILQRGGRGYFARVWASHEPGAEAAAVVATDATDAFYLSAWGEALRIGGEAALRLAGAPGRMTINRLQVHEVDSVILTPPLVFTIAALRAGWAAIGFTPRPGTARRVELYFSPRRKLEEDEAGRLRDALGDAAWQGRAAPAWFSPTAEHIARDVDERGDFALMPVLGDALEDAGCDDDFLLGHCRAGGPHFVNCWALDVALGREWRFAPRATGPASR